MLWIILIIIGTVLSICGYTRVNNFNKHSQQGESKKDPVFAIICTVITAISCLITIVQGIDGVTDYPYLVKRLAKAETLQARIVDIKNAHYKYEADGELIAGSIENWKQSTILSNYISQLAVIESDYNGYLKECIAYKETFILRFIGAGWAISDKIYELKYISK